MTREAIEEVKAECRRWWARLAWGREAMRRNMETFRRCGKMTAEIEADNAKAEVERARQMRLAAAARVGIAALETRAAESSSLRRMVGRIGSGANEQSGAGGRREDLEAIVCPHCEKEMDDSEDWGCPDMNWSEIGQCPHCEKEFGWSRDVNPRYTVFPLAGEGESGNDSEPGHSPNSQLSEPGSV